MESISQDLMLTSPHRRKQLMSLKECRGIYLTRELNDINMNSSNIL